MQAPFARPAPRVWLLLGQRPGEVAQLRTLARALRWPVIEKQLGRDALIPPWPELALAFGKDLRLLGKIRRASGGRTRIVQLARSRGLPPGEIDLLIAMPQDQVPPAPNVVRLTMSFNRREPAELAAAAQRLAPSLAHLPRPWTALIVGGASRHFRFDEIGAAALGRRASEHVKVRGGSLLVSTSPRTGAAASAALRAAIDAPCAFYDFSPGDPENPLAGYLALADDLVITGDTSSMLAEAWRTAKPVYVAPMQPTRNRRRRLIRELRHWIPARIYRALLARGLISAPVDLRKWIDERVLAGDFGLLGGPPPCRLYRAIDDDELDRVVARIRTLPLPMRQ